MLCPVCQTKNKPDRTTCLKCSTVLLQHLPKGSKLAKGRYNINEVLGEGGFGITYKGVDSILERQVAIKELFPEGATRVGSKVFPPRSLGLQGFTESKTSFRKEASCLSQFDHEGIVRIFDVVEENDTTYLVMELLKGETLAELINKKGKLSSKEVLPITQKIASALKVVHGAELLHRDIKPENIFLTEDERAVLIDFGSARQYTLNKTSDHTRLVTPGYAPYEQYVAKARFGPYTDIYALGATLYHALTGQAPLDAPSRALNDNLDPLPASIPEGLRKVITASMTVRIDARPANSFAFLALLNGSTNSKSVKPKLPINPSRRITPEELYTLEGHSDYVNTVAFCPKKDLLASGSSDKTIKLWEPSSGKILKTFSQNNSEVFSIAFSPDGNMLASKSAGNKLKVQITSNYKKKRTLSGHSGSIYSIAFSPDGTLLASGSDDRTVKLWQGNDTTSSIFLNHDHSVYSVAFNSKSNILASAGESNTIKLWQISDGVLLTTLVGHSDYIFSVAFHPKEDLLASSSMDGTIKLWRVSSGTLVRTLLGHDNWVWSVAFSPNGVTLASGSEDKTVKLWRVKDGKNLATLSGHDNFVYSVAFNHNGRTLASGSGDKTVKLWKIE